MQVLVVSPNETVRQTIAGLLAGRGADVTQCSDEEHGWQIYQTKKFELILLDHEPPHMDAAQLCQRIRNSEQTGQNIILVLLPIADSMSWSRLLDSGADDFAFKPVDVARLASRLGVAFHRLQRLAEQKNVEDSLREDIEQLRLAAQGTLDGFWDCKFIHEEYVDPRNPVWYSPQFKHLLDYDAGDEVPPLLEWWLNRLHPADRDHAIRAALAHLERRVPFDVEYRLQTKSGEYRWFIARAQAIWGRRGRATRMAGSIRDVSERKAAENRLRESEEKWRSLVQHAPDFIVTIDRDWKIQFINRVAPGFQLEEVVGQDVFKYIFPESQATIRNAIQRVFDRGEPESIEIVGSGAHNEPVWYAARLGPVAIEGNVVSVMIIATDISQRKEMDVALQKEQRLLKQLLEVHERERKLIAYEIHDGLVQQMTGSLMHLEAFEQQQQADPRLSRQEFERGMHLLRTGVGEARRMISGLRPPILDELGVVAAIEYLVNETRESVPEIEFVEVTRFKRLAPPLESALFRIVQEALSNVRRHSGAARAYVELIQSGEQLKVEVRDWGCGFSPDQVHEERFGLEGIRERARLLGGKATIESSPGNGARVSVEFPLLLGEPLRPPGAG